MKKIFTVKCIITAAMMIALCFPAKAQNFELKKNHIVKPYLSVAEAAQLRQAPKAQRIAYQQLMEKLADEKSTDISKAAKGLNDDEANETVILSEDFSLMSDGDENAPDMSVDLCDSNGDIDPCYTHMPGWWGEEVFPAGGTCAMVHPEYGGLISTPFLGNLQGKVKVSFRVKCFDEYRHYFFVTLLYGNTLAPSMATYDYYSGYIYADEGWKNFEYEFINTRTESVFAQINAVSYNNGIIIDDLKVTIDNDYVLPPQNLVTKRFMQDGFTLGWNAVTQAADYIVNLYQQQLSYDGTQDVTENFDGLEIDEETGKFIESSMPEGWDFDFTTDALAPGYNGTQGVVFRGNLTNYSGGELVANGNGGRIKNVKFYIEQTHANSDMLESYGYSPILHLSGWNGDEWEDIGDIELPGVGQSAMLDICQLMEESGSVYTANYTKIKFEGYLMDEGEFVLDEVTLSLEAPSENVLVRENVITPINEITFTNIDNDYEYFFTVQTRRDDGSISEPSELKHVFGVPAPVALPATDIDPTGSFTANWEAEENANMGYLVVLNKVFTAPTTVEDYVVLSEDFSKVNTDATIEDWESYGNKNAITSLDDVTLTSGWLGQGNIMATGMFGCREGEEPIYEIITPELKLSNGDKSYKVTVTVYFYSEDRLVIQGDKTKEYISGTAGETVTATVTLSAGTDATRVWFYTENYGAFMLDDISITQTLHEGDVMVSPYAEVSTLDTHYTFTGLDTSEGISYSYVVYAGRSLWDEEAVSEASNEILVNLNGSVEAIEPIIDELQNGEVNIYDLQGRKVASTAVSHGIYIIKQGNSTRKVIVR